MCMAGMEVQLFTHACDMRGTAQCKYSHVAGIEHLVGDMFQMGVGVYSATQCSLNQCTC